MAFVAEYPHGAELMLVPATGGGERPLPCEPALAHSVAGSFDWLHDGSGLVYAGADGRLHSLDLTSFSCRPLTRSPDALAALAVSPRGDEVAYVVGSRHVVAVATTGAGGQWPRQVSTGQGFALDPAWSPDGLWLAWHEWEAGTMPWYSSRIVVRRANGSAPARTVDGGDGVAVGQPLFAPDGSMLSYICDRSGWMNLWAVDARHLDQDSALHPCPLIEEPYEHAAPAWKPAQRSYCWSGADGALAFWRNDRGWGRLAARDASGANRELVPVSLTGLCGKRGKVVGVAEGPALAPTIQVVDGKGGVTTLAYGAPAGVEQSGAEPELVEWKSDGATIPARLYRADELGEDAPPLLVWLHGGPTDQTLATLNPRLCYFLDRGWSVLVPDARGSTGWGRAHLDALNGRWGQADVADVAGGVRAAAGRGWGDPARVAVYGGSAGGFLTVLFMALHPELVAAGVALFPVSHLLDLETPPWEYQERYLEQLLGTLPEHHAAFAERSPLSHAAEVRAPLLVLHGEEDTIVPAWHSKMLADAMRAAGGIVERHVYADQPHNWTRGPALADELERVESFLRRHVLHVRAHPGAGS